jgi:hypothetical protein
MKRITGTVMYLGPIVKQFGLYYSKTWRGEVNDENVYRAIAACKSIGQLIVPIATVGAVRRELSFDYAHNMRGTTGRFVTFYREVQKWLAQPKQPSTGVTLKHHA